VFVVKLWLFRKGLVELGECVKAVPFVVAMKRKRNSIVEIDLLVNMAAIPG
jgi:hypothetical protein